MYIIYICMYIYIYMCVCMQYETDLGRLNQRHISMQYIDNILPLSLYNIVSLSI